MSCIVAITVLTWLGPQRDDTGLAVDWIRKVSSLTKGFGNDVFRDYENSEERDKIETFEKLTPEQSAELGVPFTNTQAWDAFAAFYESPWFRRIWIVQELLPAREALVIRGNHSVDWHMVKAAAAWYVYKAFHVREELDLKYPLHGPFSAIRMNLAWNSKSGSEFHPEMFGQRVRPVVRWNFDSLLRTFHDFEASEERDKMYALFGISAWFYLDGTQELLRIDYSKPVMHVYRDAIKAHLKQNSGYQDSLNVLWHGNYQSKEPGWPSWVLDLRVKQENTGHGAPMPRLDLVGLTNSHIWRCDEDTFDDNTLLVEGMTFGSIVHHSEYQCSGDLYTNLRSQWNKFEQMYTEQFKTDKHKASGDIYESIRTAFFMALTAGKLWSGFKNKGTSPEVYAANVVDMMETFCLPHETYEEHLARMEKLKPFFELGLGSKDNAWMEWAWPKYCERRWYITDQGYVGIGTEDLQVGDVIAILWGLNKACILRPVQEDQITEGAVRKYRFIGEAYCHGAEEVVLNLVKDDGGSDTSLGQEQEREDKAKLMLHSQVGSENVAMIPTERAKGDPRRAKGTIMALV
ncbi:hypothetical protein HII31_06661 [Pseudocercospora fuligena]|uniref:Heterokaryon incompatibility domain-containing protein n=1 Tax=Pseudocercospora fuligena TaxID=685502 RepID=A0A8H6RGF2_9PEZI|nr:hypothetical protein HII31_06661 [Pseudocercospora fuligena]